MDTPVRTFTWPLMPRPVSLNAALVMALAAASAINSVIAFAYL